MAEKNELEFTIKTKADLQAAKAVEAQLGKQIETAKKLGQEYGNLEKRQQAVQSAIAKSSVGGKTSGKSGQAEGINAIKDAITESVPGLSALDNGISRVLTVTSKLSPALAAGGAALLAFLGIAKVGISAWAQEEVVITKRNSALAQAGNLTADYVERLENLAKAQRDLTGIDDEEWTQAITKLTQFGVGSGDIDRAVEAVKNLAGVLGGDLHEAARRVGAMYQGNFSRLNMLGIQIDKTKSRAEQLDSVFRQLAQRGGRQLEAEGETLSGTWKKTTGAGGDLVKVVGRVIAQVTFLKPLLNGIGAGLGFVADKADGLAKAVGITAGRVDQFDNVASELPQTLEEGASAADGLKESTDRMAEALKKANDELEAQKALISAIRQEKDEQADAEMALELAFIESQKERGRLTETQAAIAGGMTRRRYAEAAQARAAEEAIGKLAANSDFLGGLDKNVTQRGRDIEGQKEVVSKVEELEAAQAWKKRILVAMRNAAQVDPSTVYGQWMNKALDATLPHDLNAANRMASRARNALPEGVGTAAEERQRLERMEMERKQADIDRDAERKRIERENVDLNRGYNSKTRVSALDMARQGIVDSTAVRRSFRSEGEADAAAIRDGKATAQGTDAKLVNDAVNRLLQVEANNSEALLQRILAAERKAQEFQTRVTGQIGNLRR